MKSCPLDPVIDVALTAGDGIVLYQVMYFLGTGPAQNLLIHTSWKLFCVEAEVVLSSTCKPIDLRLKLTIYI